MSDAGLETRLQQILESCYAAVCDGTEPDLEQLCKDSPELRGRVERLLARERTLLKACVGDSGERELPSAPDRLGDYVILEPIGVGGMSNVFRARQEPLGREVALKVLRDDVVASPTGRLRFTREATITASLEHPHIVPVYGAGEADGTVYLAMKLLRGHSLDRQQAAFPPQQVARIGCEIASALAAAHEVGVVHRDIKPANIVLEHGTAFVVDFGLAAFADRASLLTQPNSTPGTLIYLPPEVAGRKASSLDPRADVYGIGATLYELLAGQPPFDPSNPVRALRQILHDEPRPLELKGRDRDLETIVMHAMDKSPDRRYQTAEQLAAELQRYRDGLPILTRPPGLISRFVRVVQRHPVGATLIGIIVLLSAMLTTQAALQSLEDERLRKVGTDAVLAAFDVGDLATAEDRLQQLATIATPEALAPLQRRYRRAFDEQLFVLALSHPTTRSLDGFLADLRRKVENAVADRPPPPRLAGALALERWQQTGQPQHPARPELAQQLPRLFAVLAKPPATRHLAAELDALEGGSYSGDWYDHLLCAAALRFARQPERVVEDELRRADRTTHAAALHHSLATSLEAQGRHREAYETLRPLRQHPVCGNLVQWSIARLAAILNETATVNRLLADASVDAGGDALLNELAIPSKLQVLSTPDRPTNLFWEEWRRAPARNQRMAHYWRLAGYVKADEAEALAELDDAIAFMEKGKPFAKDEVQMAGLEIGICEILWRKHATELGFLVADALPPRLLAELQSTAERCEQLADRSERHDLPIMLTTDALLTAANCRLERKEWRRARDLLDRAARYDAPLPLAEYAVQVSAMVAVDLLGDEATNSADDAFDDLRVAAHLALDRARRLILQARRLGNLNQRERTACNVTQVVCSAYVGDVRTALHAARNYTPSDESLDQTVAVLRQQLELWGGALVYSAGIPDDQLLQVMQQATALLEQERAAGSYDDKDAAEIVARWQAHPRIASRLDEPAWQAVRKAFRQLFRPTGNGR